MKKRIALLLAGIAVVSGTAFGSFNYGMQYKVNHEESYGSGNKNEWKVATGSYTADSGLQVKFDLDRDFNDRNDGFDPEGWDGYAGVYYPMPSFEMAGLTFSSKVGADFHYDQTDEYGSTAEYTRTKMGLRWQTATKLDDTTGLAINLMGQHISVEQGDIDEADVIFGVETALTKAFSPTWSAKVQLDAYAGGYSDGGSTFQKYGNPDGFNYDFYTYLNYKKAIYEMDAVKVTFGTTFGSQWYAQGSDNRDLGYNYQRMYVMPWLGAEYNTDNGVKLYANTTYKVLGKKADGGSKVSDYNEFEVTAGFKVAM